MFCPQCGQQNDAEYRFCSNCGGDLHPAGAPPAAPAQPPTFGAPPGGLTPSQSAPTVAPGFGPPLGGYPPPQTPQPVFGAPGPAPAAPPPGYAPPAPPPGYGTLPGGGVPPPTQRFDAPAPGPLVGPGGYPIGGGPPGMPPGPPRVQQHGNPFLPFAILVILTVAGLLIWKVARGGDSPSSSGSSTLSPTSSSSSPASPTTPSTPPSTSYPSLTPPPSSPGTSLPTVPGATTTVHLESVTMCRKVDGQGAPVDPVDGYSAADTFYCSMKAFGLQPGTKMAAVWQGPDLNRTRDLVSDKTGAYYVWFSLEPPSGEWKGGSYTLSLIADGVLQKQVSFDVRTSKGSSTSWSIEDAVTCRDIDREYRPILPTTTFPPSSVFHVSVKVSNMTRGQNVETRWFKGSEHLKDISIKLRNTGSGYLAYTLRSGSSGWEVGSDYHVDVYVDNQFARRANFSVER